MKVYYPNLNVLGKNEYFIIAIGNMVAEGKQKETVWTLYLRVKVFAVK